MRLNDLVSDDTDADTIRGDSSDGSAYCDNNNKRKRGGRSEDGFDSSSSSGLSEPPSDSSDTDYEQPKKPRSTLNSTIRNSLKLNNNTVINHHQQQPPPAIKRGRGRPKKDQSLTIEHINKATRGHRGRIPKPKPAPIKIPSKVGRARRKSLDPRDVMATDRAGQTNLHIACQQNNLEAVKDLIDRGADINAQDNSDWTPLHEAAYAGHIEIVDYLLENGARVNAVDQEGDTPLHDACYQEHSKVVKLLLEYGADIEKRNDKNKKPDELTSIKEILILLHTPVNCPKSPKIKNTQPPITPSLAIAFDLLQTNEPNSPITKKPTRAKSSRDDIPKVRSSTRNQRASVPNDALRLEPRFKDKETGRTHLHNHAKKGRVQEISLLLETYANPNAADFEGRTPLHDAAFEGHLDAITVLLAFQGNPNAKDKINKNTPLHEAARKGHALIVELLIQNGADPDAINEQGKTPFNLAKNEEVRNILRRIYTERGIPYEDDTESITHSSPMYTDDLESPISPKSPGLDINYSNSKSNNAINGKSYGNGHLHHHNHINGIEKFKLSSADELKLQFSSTPNHKINGKSGNGNNYSYYKMDIDYEDELSAEENFLASPPRSLTPTRTANTRTTITKFNLPPPGSDFSAKTPLPSPSFITNGTKGNTSSSRDPVPSSRLTPSSPREPSATSRLNSNSNRESQQAKLPSFALPIKFQRKLANACIVQREE
ncbi:2929_t:CDS:1 [Ambispora gerdemannii]|uniref:2929_t:CDS:1 n=1 Tax=Ambispora gerdemannii TaxID=144530 RepID=A0A9N8YKP7_9GLOM|nr:2929_t:CDS:1 [Ambispora gerdemannii]